MFIIAKEKFDSKFEAQVAAYNGRMETLTLNRSDDINEAIEIAEGIIKRQDMLDERRLVIYKQSGSKLFKLKHEKLYTVYLDRTTNEITQCRHLVTNSQASSALH